MREKETNQERLRGRGQRRARVPSPARPHPSASTTRGTGTPLLPPRPPPQKRAHSRDTHTHHRGGDPRRTPGLRETTPPLGLRHLSDDLERSRGTTEGPTRHARAPARGGRSAAAVQPSPPRGGPLAEHTPGRRSESICCVRRPTAPTDATRGGGQETEGQGQRPQPSPRLPPPPRRPGGKSQARGPADRPRRADTFPGNTCPSSGTA